MRFIFPKPLINPLAAEFFIYMLPFPVNQGVLPFTESHLTLCWLHKRQTSQVICAVVAAAVEALTDIGEPSKLVSGKAKGENCSNIQPSLPQIRKENVSPWNLPHRTATTWPTSCEAECLLSIWGICGHVQISLIPKFSGAEGVAPPLIPRSKGGTPPFWTPPEFTVLGGSKVRGGSKRPFFSRKIQNGAKRASKEGLKPSFHSKRSP